MLFKATSVPSFDIPGNDIEELKTMKLPKTVLLAPKVGTYMVGKLPTLHIGTVFEQNGEYYVRLRIGSAHLENFLTWWPLPKVTAVTPIED